MRIEIMKSLVNNTTLLLSLGILYSFTFFKINQPSLLHKLLTGCIIGIIGIGIMSSPFQYLPGIVFDTRSILISVTGCFLGLIPTLVAVIFTSVYRIFMGGIGVWTGILSISLSAVLGLIWNHHRLYHASLKRRHIISELYFFSIIVHIFVLLAMTTLPQPYSATILKHLSIPIIFIFPLGSLLLSVLLLNVRDHHVTTRQLEESEARYRSIFNNNHATMLVIDPINGNIIDANPAACSYYGWSHHDMQNLSIFDINTAAKQTILINMQQALHTNENYFEFQHRLANGAIRDVEVYSGPIQIMGKPLLYSIIHDVTESKLSQKKLRFSEERLRVTLLSVGDGVITTDNNGNISMINRIGEKITGWKSEEALGKPITEIFKIVHEDTREKVSDPVQAVLETGSIITLADKTILICKDEKEKPIADSAAPIKEADGTIQGAVLVFRDATEERKQKQEILYLGYHDSLTGLFNRHFFDEKLKKINTKENHPISLIIGDVNGLKLINDAFGHQSGDVLLQKMAKTIQNSCRERDIVARWGGDEFIVLLLKTDLQKAKHVSKTIQSNCSKIVVKGVNASISLGYETKREVNVPLNTLLKRAEDYMYRHKLVEHQSMRNNALDMILATLYERNSKEKIHSQRVSQMCQAIGNSLALPDHTINELKIAGLMHDIGKIAISEEILNKRNMLRKDLGLTSDELKECRKHAEIGYRIISASKSMSHIAKIVLLHHENFDGSGYPNGIAGQDIPLETRILSVANAYVFLTTDFVSRPASTPQEALRTLEQLSGTKYDSEIVAELTKVINNKKDSL